MGTVFYIVLLLLAIFLILLILVQRGRGGGLVGALGGPGGQSAFGAKAGDVFTRITTVVALLWILLCVVATMYYSRARQTGVDVGEGVRAAPSGSPERTGSGPAPPTGTPPASGTAPAGGQ